MGSKLRFVFLVLSFLIVGVVALAIVQLVRDAAPKVVTLPDGSVVEVHAALMGTDEFRDEAPFFRVIRRYAPASMVRWLPSRTVGRAGNTNELSIYMTRKNAAGGRLGPFWGRIEAVDDEGFIYMAEHGGSFGVGDFIGFSTSTFPRRGKTILFKAYDQRDVFLTQWTVPNPVSGPFKEWKPEGLLITKTNGPVELTLKGGKVVQNKRGYTYCNWFATLRSDDPLWSQFGEQRYSWLTDATGNSGGFLSPREPAWKVHFECYRKATTPFSEHQVWRTDNITVPVDGAVDVINLSNTVEGMKIWIPFIAGAATVTTTNGTNISAGPFNGSHWSSGSDANNNRWVQRGSDCPFLMLQTTEPVGPTEVIFRLRDMNGQIIAPERDTSGWTVIEKAGERVRDQQKRFKVTAGQRISLEIVVNRGYEFEFTVDPRAVAGTEKFLQSAAAAEAHRGSGVMK